MYENISATHQLHGSCWRLKLCRWDWRLRSCRCRHLVVSDYEVVGSHLYVKWCWHLACPLNGASLHSAEEHLLQDKHKKKSLPIRKTALPCNHYSCFASNQVKAAAVCRLQCGDRLKTVYIYFTKRDKGGNRVCLQIIDFESKYENAGIVLSTYNGYKKVFTFLLK